MIKKIYRNDNMAKKSKGKKSKGSKYNRKMIKFIKKMKKNRAKERRKNKWSYRNTHERMKKWDDKLQNRVIDSNLNPKNNTIASGIGNILNKIPIHRTAPGTQI